MHNTAVIIANWNGKKYLKNCFDSLASQTHQNFKIIFVDNGSSDGSADFVRENFPKTQIIGLKKNTGFARGYNIGIKKALEDENIKSVVVLNNDTKLHEKFIENMTDCSERHPRAGSIQSKVLNFFEKNRIDCTGIVFSADGVIVNRGYGERDRGQFEKEEEIFGANAAAALFTREALEETQLSSGEYFDNSYFAFFEDADLAWRMRLAGFKSYFCPKAFVYHIHSATANRISGFKAYYLNRNRFFTLIKNYPLCRLALIFFIITPVRYIFLLFRVIMKKGRKGADLSGQSKSTVAKEILRAWGSVIANILILIKKRRIIWKKKKVGCGEIRRWLREYRVKFSKTF
ncbi:MAG: glycosyltransferase family 2 protein [Candidatus Moranbacteria bacterium]|nr:glycosyltransferase family 2 protein [Candidatus Moranbacteria bacterium]